MKALAGRVVVTFECVFWCDHSNESYLVVFSCGTVYRAVKGSSNFLVSHSVTTQMKATW